MKIELTEDAIGTGRMPELFFLWSALRQRTEFFFKKFFIQRWNILENAVEYNVFNKIPPMAHVLCIHVVFHLLCPTKFYTVMQNYYDYGKEAEVLKDSQIVNPNPRVLFLTFENFENFTHNCHPFSLEVIWNLVSVAQTMGIRPTIQFRTFISSLTI